MIILFVYVPVSVVFQNGKNREICCLEEKIKLEIILPSPLLFHLLLLDDHPNCTVHTNQYNNILDLIYDFTNIPTNSFKLLLVEAV